MCVIPPTASQQVADTWEWEKEGVGWGRGVGGPHTEATRAVHRLTRKQGHGPKQTIAGIAIIVPSYVILLPPCCLCQHLAAQLAQFPPVPGPTRCRNICANSKPAPGFLRGRFQPQTLKTLCISVPRLHIQRYRCWCECFTSRSSFWD